MQDPPVSPTAPLPWRALLAAGTGMLLAVAGAAMLVTGQLDGAEAPPGAPRGLLLGLAAVLLSAAAGATWLLWRHSELARQAQEARARQRALLELVDDWYWCTDAHHRLSVLRPPPGAPAAHWQTAERLGRPLWDEFPACDAGGEAQRAVMEAHAVFGPLQARRREADGPPTLWRLRGRPRFDADGRFAGYEGTAREMPPEGPPPGGTPAAPQQDSEAARLEQEAARLELESFSYTVSHDLRAPIRVVEGFTRILKEDYGHALDRIGRDHLDRVLGAAARMNGMIDALLALSRLSAQPLSRQPVDLSRLAAAIADELQRLEPSRRAELRIQPGLEAQGDPVLLRVLLENLLGNAWKYSARCECSRIEFSCGQAPDGRQVFRVRDNGAGFDMRFAERLFGVFQRLHSASDFPGTGVGLATVQRIVRRHGGQVWAEAEVGRGATFHFTLAAPREDRAA